MAEMVEALEHSFLPLLQFLRLLIEATAAFWILVGVGYAIVGMVSAHVHYRVDSFKTVRLRFSRYLSLALEFQLAADILSTTIAPTFDELARLAIVAVIRTGLNIFLSKEMKEEREEALRGHELPIEARPADAVFHPISPPVVRA
jgi:uncharacterized membrane protein